MKENSTLDFVITALSTVVVGMLVLWVYIKLG
jgi:hypothetical protein